MISSKKILFHGAFKIVDLKSEISIPDFAYRILTLIGGISSSEASEYVSKYGRSIVNNLNKQNDELRKRGITIIGNVSGDRVSWLSSSPIQNLIWKIRPIFLEIIDTLSDDKFEALCCMCMSLMNGSVWRTRTKGDGNVDLYAIANTKMDNHIFGYANKIRVVGQCKNYSHKESITNFEAFFRAIENVKFQSSRVLNEMPNEFMRENGPILGWYICKDGFQSGIIDEARKHGIVLSDKYDLVEILIKLELKGISSLKTSCRINFFREVNKYL